MSKFCGLDKKQTYAARAPRGHECLDFEVTREKEV